MVSLEGVLPSPALVSCPNQQAEALGTLEPVHFSFPAPASDLTSSHAIFFIELSAVPLLDKSAPQLPYQDRSETHGLDRAPEGVRPTNFIMGYQEPQELFQSWTLLSQLCLLPGAVPQALSE